MGTLAAAFRLMVREEWRLHARLFGGRRFVAFPALVGLLAAGGVRLLAATGTPTADVVGGLFALAFAFGLHTGTVGFVGRDAVENLLGEVTLLAFSARSLPVSRRRMLAVFVAKDLAYYAALFLAPLAVAPAAGGLGPAVVPLLWVTLVATFALGTAVTIAAIGVASRGVPGYVVLALAAAGAGLAWAAGLDPVAASPYGLYAAPSVPGVALAVMPAAVLFAAGVFAFDGAPSPSERTVPDRFDAWRARLPVREPGLVVRGLLEVGRSSGGFGKVAVSAGVLFLVGAVLADVAARLAGVAPSPGVFFGALLGLSAFTTYNWLVQFDDPRDHRHHPISVAAQFRAKFRAFLVLGPPTGLAFLGAAAVAYGVRPASGVAGAVVLVGVELYLFGVTVVLAGFSPNEFLFDPVLFGAFGVAVAAAVVPLVLASFVPPSPALLAGVTAAAVALAGIGVGLYRRAPARWTPRIREG